MSRLPDRFRIVSGGGIIAAAAGASLLRSEQIGGDAL
jgi:hypothetical protein